MKPSATSLLVLTCLLFEASVSIADDAIPVSVMQVVSIPIGEEISLTGDLMSRRVSLLSTEVDGIVNTLHVDVGDVVNQGEVVVELEVTLADIAARRARAMVDEARARLSESKRRHLELTQLKQKQHVPQTNVEAAGAEIAINTAALAQSLSEQARAETLVRKHRVVAPFGGVINRKLVEIGQWVDTSSALVELVETDHLRLEIPVPQFYFADVDTNTRVKIQFDALPERSLETTISTKIPVSDNAARTFPVRIDLDNQDNALAPGMSAKVTLRMGDSEEGSSNLISRDAIVRKPDGSVSVWVVAEEDGVQKAQQQIIKTGRSYRDGVEVLSTNLSAGHYVIVRGNELLRPGQSIRVAEELNANF